MNVLYEYKTEPLFCEKQSVLSPMPHMHKELEIIFVHRGGCVAHADSRVYELQEGDLYIAFPNQAHYYEKSQPGDYSVLILLPDQFYGMRGALRENLPESNVIRAGNAGEMAGLIQSAHEAGGAAYPSTRLNGYMNLLMCGVMERLSLKPTARAENTALRKVLDYCLDNFYETLSLDGVSHALHLSKYHISRLLNAKLNLSFSDYVSMLRTSAACTMLREADKKIADVSEDAGFGTIRSMNRAFQRHLEMTPLEYRALFKR